MDNLFKKFSDIDLREALLYKFLSYIDMYHRIPNPRPDFNEWTQDWIKREKNNDLWKGMELSLDILKALYKEIVGKDFNEDESQNDLVNPNRTNTKVNLLARRLSDFRDSNIVSEIEKYWQEGKNVFVVFGRGHLVIEKPALEKLIK
ncbi:MAG: hypothetical protein WAW92_02835 [Minisyncoccia bacterium]